MTSEERAHKFHTYDVNVVDHHPSNGLILTVKKLQSISNLTISADRNGLLAPEKSLNRGKTSCHVHKKHSLDITRHYNLLISVNISKF